MPDSASIKSRKNEREATRYEGVYQRVFYDLKHEGKPVISFTIDYYNPQTGKRVRETVGRSDRNNMSAKLASKIRHSRLERLEAKAKQGIIPQNEKDIPTLGMAWERYHNDWLIAHKKPRAYNDNSTYRTHLEKHQLHNREIAKLKVHDLDFDNNLIFIRKPKNTHSRYAFMPNTLKGALANWLVVNPTGSILTRISRLLSTK